MFMMSSGGLTAAHLFQGKDAILSGPAGGVVGAVETAQMAGLRPRHRLRHGRHLDRRVALRRRARARLRDGGGGRADARADDAHPHRRGGRRLDPLLRAGPLSRRAAIGRRQSRPRLATAAAGRSPSPTPTSWSASCCPSIFRRSSGRRRTSRSTPTIVREKFAALAREHRRRRDAPSRRSPTASSQVAVENMANAIKKISVARGYDVTRYALACFGGAGGQHACMIADRLGMETVHIHPLSGVLSAYGMGLADIRAIRSQAAVLPLDAENLRGARSAAREAARGGCSTRSPAQGVPEDRHRHLSAGASPLRRHRHGAPRSVRDAAHRRDAARLRGGAPGAVRLRLSRASRIVAEAIEVEAAGGGAAIDEPDLPLTSGEAAAGEAHALLLRRRLARRRHLSPRRACARPSHRRPGADHRAAPDDRGRAGLGGGGDARRTTSCSAARRRARATHAIGTEADPVMLEVFNNLFMSIAEQMGVTLQNTAYSVNIKERLDFSCALFDADRRAGRERAAHAGASRLDGPLGRHRAAAQPGHFAGRRLCAERAVQWRHASAGHHGGDAGVRRRGGRRQGRKAHPPLSVLRAISSGSPRAGITPMSAARRPAR